MCHQGTDFSIFSYVNVGNFAFLGIFPFHSHFQIYWHKFVHYFLLSFWNLRDLQYCPSFHYCIGWLFPPFFFSFLVLPILLVFSKNQLWICFYINYIFIFVLHFINIFAFIISIFLLTLGFIYCQSHLLHFLFPSLYFQFQNFHSNPFLKSPVLTWNCPFHHLQHMNCIFWNCQLFIPMYFVLLDVIVTKFIFWISFLNCSLLVISVVLYCTL